MRLVFIIVMSIFYNNSYTQSLQFFGLKGKVKSIQEEIKICSNRYGKPQAKDCSTYTSEKDFSKEGYLLEYKDLLGDSSITREKVETPTGWLEIVYEVEDVLKIKIVEHHYNKDNLLMQSKFFNEKGVIVRLKECFYDDKGKKTKWEEISHINDGKEKTITFFDEYGTSKTIEIYVSDKLESSEDFDIQYKFDEQGNWIQSIITDPFSTNFHTRKITYY